MRNRKAGKNWLGKIDIGFHIREVGFEKLEEIHATGPVGLELRFSKESFGKGQLMLGIGSGLKGSCRKRRGQEEVMSLGSTGEGLCRSTPGGSMGLRRETASSRRSRGQQRAGLCVLVSMRPWKGCSVRLATCHLKGPVQLHSLH